MEIITFLRVLLLHSLQVSEGKFYRFDISDTSVGSHPFRLSTTEDGSHNGGSPYTTGVTVVGTQGQAGAYVELQVTKATANHLYYYCTAMAWVMMER